MNLIAQSIQSTHIDGGNDERLCSVLLLAYLKLDSEGAHGNELYKVGGKREIEVVVSCEMERNGLRKNDRVSNGEAARWY